MQAVLQGPRQVFRLPVADFKQQVLDAQNGIEAPAHQGASLKVRLPIGKGSLAGHAGKAKSRPPAPHVKFPGQSRYTCTMEHISIFKYVKLLPLLTDNAASNTSIQTSVIISRYLTQCTWCCSLTAYSLQVYLIVGPGLPITRLRLCVIGPCYWQ